MKHRDKLARRVQRLEDQHRRDMIALRRETVDLVTSMTRDPSGGYLIPMNIEEAMRRRLRSDGA